MKRSAIILAVLLESLFVFTAFEVQGEITTLNPIADSYVDSYLPNQNYGTSTTLRVMGEATNYRTLLKFDFADIALATINKATLRMYVNVYLGGPWNNVSRATNNSWTETGVTWNNQPSVNFTHSVKFAPKSGWNEIAITDLLRDAQQVGSILSIRLHDPAEGGYLESDVYYSSRQGANQPQLVIVYNNDAPTIGNFQAPSSVYVNQFFFLNASVQDLDGSNEIVNATLQLTSSVVLRWVKGYGYEFALQSDPNDYCSLDQELSFKSTINSTAYRLSWRIKLNAPIGWYSIVGTNTKVWDINDASGTNSKSNLFQLTKIAVTLQAQDSVGTNLPRQVKFNGTLANGTSFTGNSNSNGELDLITVYGSHFINVWWSQHLTFSSSVSITGNGTAGINTKIARLNYGASYVLFSLNYTDMPTPQLQKNSNYNWAIGATTAAGLVEFKMDNTNWVKTTEPYYFTISSTSYTKSTGTWVFSNNTFSFQVPFSTQTLAMSWDLWLDYDGFSIQLESGLVLSSVQRQSGQLFMTVSGSGTKYLRVTGPKPYYVKVGSFYAIEGTKWSYNASAAYTQITESYSTQNILVSWLPLSIDDTGHSSDESSKPKTVPEQLVEAVSTAVFAISSNYVGAIVSVLALVGLILSIYFGEKTLAVILAIVTVYLVFDMVSVFILKPQLLFPSGLGFLEPLLWVPPQVALEMFGGLAVQQFVQMMMMGSFIALLVGTVYGVSQRR